MIALLLGCTDVVGIPLHFDGPAGAAWLPESVDLPFDRPVGFVSNSRSGDIVPLDLKEGRLLTDDRMASFLRASAITTGQSRQLRDVAAFASGGRVELWAIDVAGSVLVQAPYITGIDENLAPIEVVPVAGEVSYSDTDGSGDGATMSGVVVRAGFTTTEDWSIEYGSGRWWAKGSRSGTQEREPVAGETYTTDRGQLEFTIKGTATEGDRFDLHTETGVVEWAVAGRPTALLADGNRLFVAVESETPVVDLIDPFTGAWAGSVGLPLGASPWRMTRAADGTLYVADAKNPAVYEISFANPGDVASATVRSLATAAPVLDVAWQSGELEDGTPFERLFVAPVALTRVDIYDLLTDAWFDPNPADPEVEGVDLGAPIAGLTASVGTVRLQQTTAWGAYPQVPTVVVATQDGFVFMLDATTGCGVVTERGPHGPNEVIDASAGAFYAELEDQGPTSDSSIAVDSYGTGEQITVSQCGGVARGESWNVVYNSANVSWDVSGSLSGDQLEPAYDDQRYVSDNGAVSFLIQSGSAPATDGDRFEFVVDRGLLAWAGTDKDESGAIESGSPDHYWEAPGRPVAFEFLSGPSGGGWDDLDRKEMAILPVENTDVAARVFLDAGKAEVDWE
ncbi:hypothetical protein LBMAG42_37170 [Deltaproteobacteria bacterium]|nr:hypothetical protein LBMAG42_37170 [Deltaproteobacteria bacterium]